MGQPWVIWVRNRSTMGHVGHVCVILVNQWSCMCHTLVIHGSYGSAMGQMGHVWVSPGSCMGNVGHTWVIWVMYVLYMGHVWIMWVNNVMCGSCMGHTCVIYGSCG
jgi:hypothetical protein